MMREAWLIGCALLSLILWGGYELSRLLFRTRYGSAILAGLVVGRVAVDRGW